MEEESSNGFDPSNAFTQMWTQFATNMARAGTAFSPSDVPPDAARSMRNAMFQAMAQYCDQYMRSPEFLEVMRQSMRSAVEMRKQLNEFLAAAHHEAQGASSKDVDQLMLALRHIEHRIVDSVERMTERLDEIDERLASLENGTATPQAPTGKTKTTKTTAKSGTARKKATRKSTRR